MVEKLVLGAQELGVKVTGEQKDEGDWLTVVVIGRHELGVTVFVLQLWLVVTVSTEHVVEGQVVGITIEGEHEEHVTGVGQVFGVIVDAEHEEEQLPVTVEMPLR